MPAPKSEVLQGTLDLLVLKTLDSMGPMHGFGIALRIQQVSEDLLQLNQGTLYPALLRHEQRGWIVSKWGTSENNRRARFYRLTPDGRKRLEQESGEFYEKVRDGYLELAKWQRDRVVVIEGWKSPYDIEKEIWEMLVKRFPELAAKSEINNQEPEI